jgi:lactam utilization protein B
MTVPFYIEEPNTWKQVQVPPDIIEYCDEFTLDADREDLRYIDCVWMHMGYYGTPAHIMKAVREEYRQRIMTVTPIFN